MYKVTLFFNPSNIILKKRVACTSFALQKRKLLNDAIHKVSVTTFIWGKNAKQPTAAVKLPLIGSLNNVLYKKKLTKPTAVQNFIQKFRRCMYISYKLHSVASAVYPGGNRDLHVPILNTHNNRLFAC